MGSAIQGILLGLSLSLLLGPAIFMFIDAATEKGMKGGLMVAAGVWLSDLCYIALAVSSFSLIVNVIESENFAVSMGSIGGLILVIFGIHTFMNGRKLQRTGVVTANKNYIQLLIKGFVVNIFNPFCALIWLGSISTAMLQGVKGSGLIIFVASVLGTLIVTDVLKVGMAKKLVTFLSGSGQLKLKKISGLGLAVLGVALLVKVLV